MSLASVLLILAALASPASEARHVDAVKILSYDFDPNAVGDKNIDVNYDLWPDLWRRKIGPGKPHYVVAQLEDDETATAGRCLTVRLNGGGALIMSPAVGVSNKFSYVVDAKLKVSDLNHGRVQLRIDFCDESDERNILVSITSEWLNHTDGWVTVQIGPISISHPDVKLTHITLDIERGERVDLKGVVSLDDIWFARLPRMKVDTNSHFNVYTDPKDVVVTCELSGILERRSRHPLRATGCQQ